MQRWTNPRTGAWIELSSDGDDTVLERVMKPHTGKADPHRHLAPYNETDADLHLRHRAAPGSLSCSCS